MLFTTIQCTPIGRIYICGLLGTTSVTDELSDDDHWMATDFVAIRQLLGVKDELSVWLTGTPIRTQRGFLLGDLAYSPQDPLRPPPFETVHLVEPRSLAVLPDRSSKGVIHAPR
jgi:hypothetical protein